MGCWLRACGLSAHGISRASEDGGIQDINGCRRVLTREEDQELSRHERRVAETLPRHRDPDPGSSLVESIQGWLA
jgi:hypothetical protein